MLGTRLASGIPMALGIALVLFLDEWFAPWYPLWFLTSVVVFANAAAEITSLLGATSARPSANAVLGGTLAITASNWGPHVSEWYGLMGGSGYDVGFDPSAPIHDLAWPLLTFVGVMMFAFVAQGVQFRRPGATMATIGGTLLALGYIGLLGSFLIQLRWFEGPSHGVLPVIALIAVTKGTDIGAYTMGRIAGRHKLWPRLSPNKTIEGALGGLAFGLLGAVLVALIAREAMGIPMPSWPAVFGYGLLVSAAAQLGDLMESMIKRDCERKDSSSSVPGYGGVLDVIDSLLFAAPVAFGYWLLFAP
ncbi:MAG: phosphatidate cytidylyltransferase [Isosphaeraceae bacterium]